MLGWGRLAKLGLREAIRWLPGDISVLAAASSFVLSQAVRVTEMKGLFSSFLKAPPFARLNMHCCFVSQVAPGDQCACIFPEEASVMSVFRLSVLGVSPASFWADEDRK